MSRQMNICLSIKEEVLSMQCLKSSGYSHTQMNTQLRKNKTSIELYDRHDSHKRLIFVANAYLITSIPTHSLHINPKTKSTMKIQENLINHNQAKLVKFG